MQRLDLYLTKIMHSAFGVNTIEGLMEVDKDFKENYLESLAAVGGIDGRKARIREKINELKQELLTLEKQEDYV